jgi:alanyl-tRNA synthetase
MAEVRDVGGVRVLAARTETADLRSLRTLGDELRGKMGSSVLVLVGVADGKVGLMAMVTPDLTDRIQANKIVEALGALVGGRGGGRPELAQGGGDRPESVPAALERAYQVVAESLASSG